MQTCGLSGRVSSIHSAGDGGINEACAVRLNTYMEARGCKAGAGLWNSVRVEEDMLLTDREFLDSACLFLQCQTSCHLTYQAHLVVQDPCAHGASHAG